MRIFKFRPKKTDKNHFYKKKVFIFLSRENYVYKYNFNIRVNFFASGA